MKSLPLLAPTMSSTSLPLLSNLFIKLKGTFSLPLTWEHQQDTTLTCLVLFSTGFLQTSSPNKPLGEKISVSFASDRL